MKYNIIDTTFTRFHMMTEDDYLCGLFFNSETHRKVWGILRHKDSEEKTLFVRNVVQQLEEYFLGMRKKFDIPYQFIDGTDFEQKVWRALENIPYGTTKTYKQIAEEIGNPKAVRVVANAIGMNPISIIVPCHRVVGSDGTLHGYAGGVGVKEKLLGVEGFFGGK